MRASAALDRFAALAPELALRASDGRRAARSAAAAGGTVDKVEYLRSARRRYDAAVQHCAGAAAGAASAPAGGRAFDALLLPEGGAQLKQIAARSRRPGRHRKPVQLLGSGLVGRPDIGSDPALVGGWFASSPPEARRDFERRFSATYGRTRRASPRSAMTPRRSPRCWRKAGGGEPFSQRGDPQPERLHRRRRAVPLYAATVWCSAASPCSKSSRKATSSSARRRKASRTSGIERVRRGARRAPR